ncbi:MAG: alpha/beta fold hydrolase [Nibricoccus sp.]
MHRPLASTLFALFFLLGGIPATFAKGHSATAEEKDIPLESVVLSRGAYQARVRIPAAGTARAIVILGSGDGGWSYWEERVAKHLGRTCAVVGVDFSTYSASDYSQSVLAADLATLTALARSRVGGKGAELPVIYGGWSMGAEQAVAAAGAVQSRPPGLRGLLLVAPGERGRYGLRLRDRVGLAPSGDGTFGLADFAVPLKGLRLAQFHAKYDLLDTPEWAAGLDLDLKRFDLPRGFHDFEGAGPDFLKMVDEAVDWIVTPEAQKPAEAKPKVSP